MSRNPRWIVVTHSAAPGGAELGLVRYAEHSRRVDRVISFADGWLTRILSERGTPVLVDKSPGRRLRRLLREDSSLVVMSNTLRAALIVAIARVPRRRHVIYVQDAVRGGYFSLPKRLLIELVILRSAAVLLANSEFTVGSLPRSLRRRAVVVGTPSGILTPDIRVRNDALNRPVKVLSLSRLTPWKGIHVLLDALAILSERLPADMGLEITIAGAAHFGEEEYEASLKERARNMRFPVAFVGHVDNVDDLLADTDILVHTSTTPEPFGQVIIQGLASGAHTIVADAGGAAEIVLATKRGMRTTPGDAQELAAAIERIVRDGRSASGPDLPVRYTDPAVAGAIDGQLQRWSC